MRILIANPDTIGDLVLRQPMIAALTEAGHELMLLVRASVAPLARQIAPDALVVEYPAEPYALAPDGPWEPFEPAFEAAATFGPALLVIAPYRWTLAEEKLAERLSVVPRVGMSGNLYRGDPYAGAPPASSLVFDQVAAVNEGDLEVVKNTALASVVLGRPVRLGDPKLVPSDDALAEARQLLAEVGYAPGEYWATCVGGTAHVALKTWPAERWAGALSHWAARHGRKFLFVGLPQERPAVDVVRAAMGLVVSPQERSSALANSDRADLATTHTAVLMRDDISLATLTALIALSQGYAGHDTGPMHVAAATGRPVLAVFGGGTWHRFLPAVAPSVAITVGAPCAGCGWICAFHDSYCIKSVPVDEVIGAIDDLESGRLAGRRESRVIEPTPALMARFVRESAQAAEARLREAVEARKQAASSAAEAARAGTVPPGGGAVESVVVPPAPIVPSPAELVEQVIGPLRQQLGEFREAMVAMRSELEGRLPLRPPLPPPPPPAAAPRRPLRQLIADVVVGKPHVTPKSSRPSPPISIVVPVVDADVAAVSASVESVLSQRYDNLEVVIVDDGRSPEVTAFVGSLGPRVRLLPLPDAPTFEMIAHGFDVSYGQVIAFLRPGVTYAAGLLPRVGELFRDRSFVRAAYFETTLADGALRHNLGPTRQVDTVDLLSGEPIVYDSLFWRRSAYQMVGKIKPERGDAADWDLTVRTARMFGLWRTGRAGAIVTRQTARPERDAALVEARANFLAHFGALGRARCAVLHRLHRMSDAVDQRLGVRARPTFSVVANEPVDASTGPVGEPPRCPLTRRPVDSLLFSAETPAGVRHVYYSDALAAAIVDGPIAPVTGSSGTGGPFAKDVLDTLAMATESHGSAKTLLDLSGGDAAVFDAFARHGHRCVTVTNDPERATAIRARATDGGVVVVDGDPFDAPLVVPDGQTFDVVFLGRSLQRCADPLALLRRARNLLHPGGVIALTADNLHARSLARRGAAWPGWDLAAARVIVSPVAVERLATAASLRVRKLQTRSAGDAASQLWDLRRKGDVIHAVLGE